MNKHSVVAILAMSTRKVLAIPLFLINYMRYALASVYAYNRKISNGLWALEVECRNKEVRSKVVKDADL